MTTMLRHIVGLTGLSVLALAAVSAAQPQTARADVPFHVVSVEVVGFPKPLQTAPGVDAGLTRAFFVNVEVRTKDYDALPPSIEPFLYIGGRELRTYEIDRSGPSDILRITYFSADTTLPADGLPMSLTIEHMRPARDPAYYTGRANVVRFTRDWLKPLR